MCCSPFTDGRESWGRRPRSDGGLVLTKNAIRSGCGRGELAYDYVDLGCEEIVHKARQHTSP